MELEERLAALTALTSERDTPNFNALWAIAKDLEAVKLNIKFFGYELARRLAEALPIPEGLEPANVALASKACTQEDMESDWVAYWCGELKIPRTFHRKVWEFAYVLQALYETGRLAPGSRGLGFGCGEEPIASYLASRGLAVTVTDLPPADQLSRGWADTKQHATSLEKAFHPQFIEREAFAERVDLEFIDMNAIPAQLTGYDFCWSICAFEHLGSIAQGLNFVENSLKTLKPGGVAVHTTEFNYLNDDKTIDNWPTVLFQRRHFLALHDRLTARGHAMAPINFNIGAGMLDKFIDLPPFNHDWPDPMQREWASHLNHLKLMIDGFASTCFGFYVIKAV